MREEQDMSEHSRSPDLELGTAPLSPFDQDDVEQSVAAAFEKRLLHFADRIACADVRTGDITYRDLNCRANQLAHWLRRNGDAETGAIALLLEHSSLFLIGVLATLKTGRKYVGLDPGHPLQRNREIMGDAQATLCLTDNQHLEAALEIAGSDGRIRNIEEIEPGLPDADPGLEIAPDADAAIFYTSGTTGTPKGVLNAQRKLLEESGHIYANKLGITPSDRLLFIRHGSTAASVRVVFGCLLNGATLCPWDLRIRGTAGLPQWLDAQSLTLCEMPTNVFRRCMANVAKSQLFPSVRIVVLTSEPVYATDIELWKRHFPNSGILIHQMVCNETGVYRHYVVNRSTELPSGALPIGYPVKGKEVLLWNENGDQVRPGEVGEIVVKSRYLAKGYWNRPDLTRKAFLGPAAPDQVRLYRTGDMGRMTDDGSLYFVGRKDDRVKVLGNRVDIGAVEAELLALDRIDEVAVVVEDDDTRVGNTRLAAYFVSIGNAPSVKEIRATLATRLVRSMIPAKLVRLDTLPRTATGKIDRRSLSAAETGPRSAPATPARDAIERALVGLLEDLLRVTPIGIDDDIIERGADSLTAVELVIAIERELGVRLPVEMIFAGAQTVALLAQRIRDARDGGVRYDAADARQAPRVGYAVEMSTISLRDLTEPMLLLVLCVADLVVPGRHRRMLMRAVARLLAILRPRRVRAVIEGIGHVLGERRIDLSHRALAIETQASFLERRLLRLRGWSRGSAAPPVSLEGAAHIDDACRRGNGVILWGASLVMAGMATSVALNERGYAMSMLVRPEHGFTRTKFGHLFLNRLSRENTGSLEAEQIVITGDGQAALDLVRRRLAENRIVWIGAQHQTDNPAVVPFFSGHLDLATGPPRLALATGAALLPVFTIREPDGSCRVVIEPPFTVEDTHPSSAAAHTLLPEFVAIFETYVLRDPASWKGWLSRVR